MENLGFISLLAVYWLHMQNNKKNLFHISRRGQVPPLPMPEDANAHHLCVNIRAYFGLEVDVALLLCMHKENVQKWL